MDGVSVRARYLCVVVAVRPFDAQIDTMLTIAELLIGVVAMVLSYLIETQEEEEMPAHITYGLYAVLGLQAFYLPYTAWPIFELIKVTFVSPLDKADLFEAGVAGGGADVNKSVRTNT